MAPKQFYQGKSGLATVLSEMEAAADDNRKSIFIERVTDYRILLILRDMGCLLDITSNRFTIIMWDDFDKLAEPIIHLHFIERKE